MNRSCHNQGDLQFFGDLHIFVGYMAVGDDLMDLIDGTDHRQVSAAEFAAVCQYVDFL